MLMMKRFAVIVTFVAVFGLAVGAQDRPPDGFVPVDQLAQQQETIPAAPLVGAAYGVAWAVIFLFVWSVWRRLAHVERELAEVTKRIQNRGRS